MLIVIFFTFAADLAEGAVPVPEDGPAAEGGEG